MKSARPFANKRNLQSPNSTQSADCTSIAAFWRQSVASLFMMTLIAINRIRKYTVLNNCSAIMESAARLIEASGGYKRSMSVLVISTVENAAFGPTLDRGAVPLESFGQAIMACRADIINQPSAIRLLEQEHAHGPSIKVSESYLNCTLTRDRRC